MKVDAFHNIMLGSVYRYESLYSSDSVLHVVFLKKLLHMKDQV